MYGWVWLEAVCNMHFVRSVLLTRSEISCRLAVPSRPLLKTEPGLMDPRRCLTHSPAMMSRPTWCASHTLTMPYYTVVHGLGAEELAQNDALLSVFSQINSTARTSWKCKHASAQLVHELGCASVICNCSTAAPSPCAGC